MLSIRLCSRIIAIMLSTAVLSACLHPYTPPVQQGNVLTQAEISQLKIGMSKDEVQYLVGAPVLNDDLNPDEWNYVYTFKPSYTKPMKTQKLTLHFKNGNLISIDGQVDKPLGKAQAPIA